MHLSQQHKVLEGIIKFPFKLWYNRVYRIYRGGYLIDNLQNRFQKSDDFFPEEWVGSTTLARNTGRECIVEEGLSKIVLENGEVFSLKEVIEKFPYEVVGEEHLNAYGTNAGILVKFLDSKIRLPLQCHPDRNFAKKHLNSSYGKTECWIILKTRKNICEQPYIILGFKERVNRAYFKKLIEEQNINGLLKLTNYIPVKEGEIYFIESGIIHAIGEGLFLLEIQEPTDFTFSIERGIENIFLSEEESFCGLEVDKIVSAFKFSPFGENVLTNYKLNQKLIASLDACERYLLVGEPTTRYFGAELLAITGRYLFKREERFSINVVIEGEGYIETGIGKINLLQGDSFIIPYCAEDFEVKAMEFLKIISCYIPASAG